METEERNRKAVRNGKKAEKIVERIFRVHINPHTTLDITDENSEIGEVKSCQKFLNGRYGRITIEEKQREMLKYLGKKLLVVVGNGEIIFSISPENIPDSRQISWKVLWKVREREYI